jgi:hypothetical protein
MQGTIGFSPLFSQPMHTVKTAHVLGVYSSAVGHGVDVPNPHPDATALCPHGDCHPLARPRIQQSHLNAWLCANVWLIVCMGARASAGLDECSWVSNWHFEETRMW